VKFSLELGTKIKLQGIEIFSNFTIRTNMRAFIESAYLNASLTAHLFVRTNGLKEALSYIFVV
jgi:hypothetical protein